MGGAGRRETCDEGTAGREDRGGMIGRKDGRIRNFYTLRLLLISIFGLWVVGAERV